MRETNADTDARTRRGVLVTGGSRGIGAAAVRRFARAGDRVFFTYHSGAGPAEELVTELAAEGHEVTALAFRQGERDSHEELGRALTGSRVDVLVNNAAVGSATVARHAPEPGPDRDAAFLRVNCLGPLWLVRQFAPAMIARGYGKVLNVSSVGGGVAVFPQFDVADGMSKAAVAYLTRHLAAQWSALPVDVFAVCPGAVDTGMFRASTLDGLGPDRLRAFTSGLPGGRLIEPAEVADVLWWLCEEPARILRGAVVDASLGLGSDPAALDRTPGHDDWTGQSWRGW
ncbi:SDR family NAD(P)-dependent oxidoreductase [Streptomyces sp. NPDC127098]|uniref:SDR family NAD(P)-dependent oxidoreductase n=1 Tax=Streptomyces sp. NPDC127098 TaxID=3347137 RepID=UPI0036500EB2